MGNPGESSPKGDRYERDWTQGNMALNLVAITWPVLISQVLRMIGPFIDMIWLGRLGASSVAGVGIAAMTVMLANSALMGITTGMRALIARFVGAHDTEGAVNAARQSLVIGAAYSLLIGAIGLFFAETILKAFGVESDVVHEGAAYLRIEFVGIVTMAMLTFAEDTMQSSGDTMRPMRIAIFYRLFHVALCPFLIFGLWLFPQMGVRGAATSTVVSQGLGGIIGLWVLFTGRSRLRLTLKNWRLDPDIIWRVVKVGIPNSLMHIQQHLSMLALIWFIAPFGTLAVAGHTLWQRIEMVLSTFIMGIGVGAGVLGGQNLGANQPGQAMKSGWLGVGFVTSFTIAGLIVILVWAEKITRIFTSDPELIRITGVFLRISMSNLIFLGFAGVFRHFLTLVGDTLPALLFELIPTWLLLIPLCYFMPRIGDLGVYGIRWAIAIRWIIGGIVFLTYFWIGKWKLKKV